MSEIADTEALTWRDAVSCALLALAIVTGAALRMVPGVVGVIDDDGVYAVTAKALAEGQGYRMVNLPDAPAQTRYPILYPAILSLAWRAASALESRIFAMQCTTAALAVVALMMAYLYCVRFRVTARAPAFAGCALAASAPNFLFYCSQTVSEMPFLALLVAALWATQARLRASQAPEARAASRNLLAGVSLALPLLCRSVGVVIPVVAIALLARARKPVRGLIVAMLVVTLPWVLWVVYGLRTRNDQVFGLDYLGFWRANKSLVVPVTNLFRTGLSFCHIALEGIAGALYARTDSAKWLLFVVGAVPWLVVVVRSLTFALLPMTLLSYLALICLWPWPPDRYLVPILPFLGALSFQGLWNAVARRAGGRSATLTLALVLAVVALPNLRALSHYVSASRLSGYPYLALTETPVQWRNYQRAFDWLRTHTREDEVLAAGFDTMTSLYSDRPTVRPFVFRPLSIYYGASDPALGSVADFSLNLAQYRARYLFLSPLPGYPIEEAFYGLVYAAMDERPGLLTPVWQDPDDLRFAIFEVAQDASSR